jgi:hypothetical protein
MEQDDDRRRQPRVRVAAFATMETTGALNANNQALCAVKDVSRTGIGLTTGQPPMRGQTVIVRLALDDEIHELRTRATRVERNGTSNFYVVGLDWSLCSPDELSFLDRALSAVETQPQD